MNQKQLSFEDFPSAVSMILEKLFSIEQTLSKINSPKTEDILMSVEEAAEYLDLAKPTVYHLAAKGEIPSMKKTKRRYFSKLALKNYLENEK